MPDINWGGDETTAPLSSRFDEASGNLILAEDNDGNTVLLEWDGTTWQYRGPVEMNGEDVSGVGTLTATDVVADSVNTEELNSGIAVLGGDGYESLADVVADTSKHTAILAEDVTEQEDTTINRPLSIWGQGYPFDKNVGAAIDLDGHTLTVAGGKNNAQNWCSLRVENGSVVLGENGMSGGRHHIELSVRGASGDGVTFKGGHLDCHYIIKSRNNGRGVIWSFDENDGDYFNQNVISVAAHGNNGDGIVFETVGSGGGEAPVRGNTFTQFLAEKNSGTGWIVENNYSFRSNNISGYGVHEPDGYDVTPSDSSNNSIKLYKLRGSPENLNINGEVDTRDFVTGKSLDVSLYESLQMAIDIASAGQLIDIPPGTYTSTITTANSLEGSDPTFNCWIQADSSDPAITADDRLSIERLRIQNDGTGDALLLEDSAIYVTNCRIRDDVTISGDNFRVIGNDLGGADVTITGNNGVFIGNVDVGNIDNQGTGNITEPNG